MKKADARLRAVFVALFASCAVGCAKSDPGSGDGAPASPPANPVPVAPTSASAGLAPGAPAAGVACSPGRDSIACAPDGMNELTCAGTVWRALAVCRGPAGCKGVGSALRCDPGAPLAGDPCVHSTAEPSCSGPHEALLCEALKWTVVPCAKGQACVPRSPAGPAGCR
jgi:hypothetical protein